MPSFATLLCPSPHAPSVLEAYLTLFSRPVHSVFSECNQRLHLSCQGRTDICHLLAVNMETTVPMHPLLLPKAPAAPYFYATGPFQQLLSATGGTEQSVISSAKHGVTSSLVRRASEIITLPLVPDTQRRVKQGFMAKSEFPGVLGAIDFEGWMLRNSGYCVQWWIAHTYCSVESLFRCDRKNIWIAKNGLGF